MKKTICLVGGGTGGHLFPLYPLAESLLEKGHNVHLIVNDAQLDRKIIEDKFSNLDALKVHFLKTHKIDYHLSFRNLAAPFKIVNSFYRTKKLLNKIKPEVVFFKGGFVGFPVLVSLKYLINYKGKIFLHDSDISAGKLTQFIGKNADQVFSNFGKNALPLFYWPKNPKTNTPKSQKILIFGGSQGAQFLNNLIVQNIEKLSKKFQVTLVAGPKNDIKNFPKTKNLKVFNFMDQDKLIQEMCTSQLVICRSGASMFQVLAAKAACIAIPLPTSARNHQFENAEYFEKKGLCYLLKQNKNTNEKFCPTIEKILSDETLKENLEKNQIKNEARTISEKIIS